MAALRVGEDGAVQDRAHTDTPDETEEILDAMVGLASAVRTDDVAGIGVGAAGLVDVATGVLRFAPNLPWRELPLRDRLATETGLPCVVDNDANAAAWGEYRFGAGRGSTVMLLVTVGTGIGGGIVSALLGNEAGGIGAASLALEELPPQ